MKQEISQEQIEEFFNFLQGKCPENIRITRGHMPKMSAKKAWSVIWFLQEHMNALPSNVEKCDSCGELFDIWSGGLYWQSKCKHYCGACEWQVPENYDRGKR